MSKAGRRSAVTTSEEDEENKTASRARESRIRKSGQSSSKPSTSKPSSKKKKVSAFNKLAVGASQLLPALRSELLGLASDLKAEPVQTGKRVGRKLCVYVLLFCALAGLSSLLGFGSLVSSSSGASGQRSLMGSLLGGWSEPSGSKAPEVVVDSDGNVETISGDGGTGEETEEIPEMVGFELKKSNKVNKAKEKQLACVELECNVACNKKINPKCAAKKTCKADREKICKRRCLKARCEERCKDEPKYGYVEREQKMDKCKEGCQGSTAQHNKCIKKCHSEFKPCKSRCHEISMKFQCDAAKDMSSSLIGSDEDEAPPPSRKSLKGTEKLIEESADEAAEADFDDEVI